jgi:hypothetical protein
LEFRGIRNFIRKGFQFRRIPHNSAEFGPVQFRGIPCPFLYTEFRTLKREIYWGEIWEEIRRGRERAKEIEGKEIEGKEIEGKEIEGKEIEGKRGRDRRKETEGKRQVERDRLKETEEKRHREKDKGKET